MEAGAVVMRREPKQEDVPQAPSSSLRSDLDRKAVTLLSGLRNLFFISDCQLLCRERGIKYKRQLLKAVNEERALPAVFM